MAFEIPAKPQRDRWLDLKQLRLAMDECRVSITEGRKILAMPVPPSGGDALLDLVTSFALDMVKAKMAKMVNAYTTLCALRAHHRGRVHITRVRKVFEKGSAVAGYDEQRSALQASGIADHFLPTPGEQRAPAVCTAS